MLIFLTFDLYFVFLHENEMASTIMLAFLTWNLKSVVRFQIKKPTPVKK
jgi:hypothetical protein